MKQQSRTHDRLMPVGANAKVARLAIEIDEVGRSFFVSLDGVGFRQVAHFPVGQDRAEDLFRRARPAELDENQLVARFAGHIAFMLVPK
jgi:hypothetical protein